MSNTHHFTGRVADAPDLHPTSKVCKFTLLRNERAGSNDDGSKKERVVRIQYTAFGALAEMIARRVRKGDQLIVESRIENYRYTDAENRDHYGFNFIVTELDFGAPGELTRAAMAAARDGSDR